MESLVQQILGGVRLLTKGGPLLIPMLFFSIAAMTVVLERFRNLRRERYIPVEYVARIFRLMERGKFDMGLALCESRPMLLTNLLRMGIRRRHAPEDALLGDVKEYLRVRMPELYRNHFFLTLVAAISPLLGLLGTVLGMIQGFSGLQMESGHLQMRIVADGISVALLTTFAGLAIAVPTFVVHQVLEHRANQIAMEIHRYGISLVRFLKRDEVRIFEDEDENPGAEVIKRTTPLKTDLSVQPMDG